ncbi:type II toxin-antitoxin system RnlA family toxin [Shewanella submarina]|uniref:Type II toxin-antitoxin system RnlA family toxin n=1 Tax=Shewanella submarina TaxID=2016376 RepID=A0ABV7GGN1_9GAMM|nr:type II toxin-antitoxin system RnlA family toxin [Shewanella submarina]MCL1039230.1 type II toxin-antitoxin system RnlA family toxin [Shewanella submarina]
MSYSKKNINRSLIFDTFAEHCHVVNEPELKGRNAYHYVITMEDGQSARMIFYFNIDGTTTISPDNNNKDLGAKLADLIIANCLYNDKKSVELFIPITEEDFQATMEYLQEECDAQLMEQKQIPGGEQFKLTGRCGNQLVLKYFTRRSNLQIQGKPLSLYEDLIEILSELLPYEEFVKSQLKQVEVKIEPRVVKGELESRLPHAYGYLEEKIRSIISPALALNKLAIDLEDYTSFAMPVLRGLEGYMKQLLAAKGVTVGKTFGDIIDGTGGNYRIIDSKRTLIGCPLVIQAVELCYSYWCQERHGLFHVDATIATTRVLTQEEAQQIIDRSLSLIEESCAKIVA